MKYSRKSKKLYKVLKIKEVNIITKYIHFSKKVIITTLVLILLTTTFTSDFAFAKSNIKQSVEYDFRDGKYVKIIKYYDSKGKPAKPTKIVPIPNSEGIKKIGNRKKLYNDTKNTKSANPAYIAEEQYKVRKEHQRTLDKKLQLAREGKIKLDDKHILNGAKFKFNIPEDRYDVFMSFIEDLLYNPIIDTGIVVRNGKISKDSVKELFHRIAIIKNMDYIELEDKILLSKKGELAYIDLSDKVDFELDEFFELFYNNGVYLLVSESRIDKKGFMSDYMEVYQKLNVEANNEIIHYDTTKPLLENMDVIIPIRATFEKLGANVDWDKVTKIIKVQHKSNTFEGISDSDKAIINGEKKKMKYPIYLDEKHNRSLGDLNFLLKELDVDAEWDAKEHKLILE